MNNLIEQPSLHFSPEETLLRSHWYGSQLLTVLVSAAETNGAYSVVKTLLHKNVDPPLPVHQNEDESNYIIHGEIIYYVGDKQFTARAGDYVHLPKNVPHTFKVISETASTVLIITPGGFEEMFIECGRPAEALGLPPLEGKPPAAFF